MVDTILEKTCAVTAFDMKVRVTKDGRERGLWIFLKDTSPGRASAYNQWLKDSIELVCRLLSPDVINSKTIENSAKKLHVELCLRGETERLLSSKVDEGALLEWDSVKELYEALGKALREGKVI